MKSPSSIPLDGSRNSRAWRSGRLATLAVLVILIPGFTATWVSAGRDHPARVSFMDGRAAYETSGDVDWNELTLNLPLVSGDRIVGHPDSRIEVELGDGNFVRISGETDVLFPELSQKKTILKIHAGDVILRVNDADRVQVDLELASVKIRKQGLYRIQVDPDGSIGLVVHQGPGGSQQPAREGESGDGTTTASGRTPDRKPGAGSGSGRFRTLERPAGCRHGKQPFRRVPGGRGLPWSPVAGPSWQLGQLRALRACLGTRRLGGMGSVSKRTVDLSLSRPDLGQPRALGLAPLSLRELDLLPAGGSLGLDARRFQPVAPLPCRLLLGKWLRRLGAQGLLHGRQPRAWEPAGSLQRPDGRPPERSGQRTSEDSSRGLQHHRGRIPRGSPQRTPAFSCVESKHRIFENGLARLQIGFPIHREFSGWSRAGRPPTPHRRQK